MVAIPFFNGSRITAHVSSVDGSTLRNGLIAAPSLSSAAVLPRPKLVRVAGPTTAVTLPLMSLTHWRGDTPWTARSAVMLVLPPRTSRFSPNAASRAARSSPLASACSVSDGLVVRVASTVTLAVTLPPRAVASSTGASMRGPRTLNWRRTLSSRRPSASTSFAAVTSTSASLATSGAKSIGASKKT